MLVEVLSAVQTSHLESQWLTCLYQLYAFESGLHVSLIQQTAHLEMLYPVMWLSQDIQDSFLGLQSEIFHVTVKQLLMYWYGYLQQSYNLPEPLQSTAWSPDHAVKWQDTFDVKKSYDDVVERKQSDFANDIEKQLMTCRDRYLKQSDNSRSQDHSEVLPGEKVSTHKTDSVSEEESPLINYSIFSNARNSYGLQLVCLSSARREASRLDLYLTFQQIKSEKPSSGQLKMCSTA